MAYSQDACIITEAEWLIDQTQTTQYMNEKTKTKFIATIRTAIRNNVSEDLRAELDIGMMTANPAQIIVELSTILEESRDAVNHRLEAEAKETTLSTGQLIYTYMTGHENLRWRMNQESLKTSRKKRLRSASRSIAWLDIRYKNMQIEK